MPRIPSIRHVSALCCIPEASQPFYGELGGLTRLTEHSATADRPEKCSPLHSTIAHLDSSKMFPKSDSSVKKQTTPHPRELSRRVGDLLTLGIYGAKLPA
ncbi:unnamed protein product [Prunus armeniaca]|uniref:Uncharacterized protein n=1 Tax=Prunus armeniaca TaxID=36596 RepID=A0A6J5XRQ8_PRUAR|nr:unnamed protein product [Prunus armeniaca]